LRTIEAETKSAISSRTIPPNQSSANRDPGIGTDDEDIGEESEETGVVDLPADMIDRLRVDLSVWRSSPK
jgi:hypothetical protein